MDGRTRVALALILVAALALRLYGVGFGLPALYDDDELIFELGAMKMLRSGTLNPGWFGHPATTTMYVLAALHLLVFGGGWLVGRFPDVRAYGDAIYHDPSWMILPGRLAMVGFGVLTVWLTWRLARDLFGRTSALLAAAIVAVGPVGIFWTQVVRSDVMATAFMLLCLIACVRVAHGGRRSDTAWAALWLALALATKWPYGLAGVALVAVALQRARNGGDWNGEARRVVGFFALAALLLIVISPYLLLDWPTLVRNLAGEAQTQHLGATGGGPLANAWWYATGPLLSGLGPLAALLAAAGCALIARQKLAMAVIGSVTLAFALLLATQHLVWERWALALLPLLAIAAGVAFARFVPAKRLAVVPALAMLLLPPVAEAFSRTRERTNDARALASAWLRTNVAPNSRMLIEHTAFDLIEQPWSFYFPLGERGCVDARALLAGKVEYGSIDATRGGRSNLDYGTMPPEARARCLVDYAVLTHADRYAAERAAFPAEDRAYREFIARGCIVATFRPERGRVGGRITRIVSFRPDDCRR